jgi:hypothetical protein
MSRQIEQRYKRRKPKLCLFPTDKDEARHRHRRLTDKDLAVLWNWANR